MTRRKLVAMTVLLVSVALISGGCGKKEADSYKIGALLPLTGDLANYGTACKRGMDMAADEINAKGGVRGKRIEILYEDSKASPKDAVSIAQKYINIDKVQVLIGEVASTATLAVIPVAEQSKVFLFAPASSSPKLTGASEYFARNWPSDVAEASATAAFVMDSLGLSRTVILYVNSDYGIGLEGEFRKSYALHGGTVVASEAYPFGESNFKTLVQKIARLSFDCVYLAGNHKEMAFLTKQLRELKVKQQIVGDTDYGDPEVVRVAGSAAEGVVFGTPSYDPKDQSQRTGFEFTTKYEAKFGTVPTLSEANGYDAIMLITAAVNSHGYDGTEIAKYIRSLKKFDGAAGTVSFENGDVIRPVIFKRIIQGRPQIYSSATRAQN